MKTSKCTQTDSRRLEEIVRRENRVDLPCFQGAETDTLVEMLFDSMQCSPLGRLLKIISTLPEVRSEKVEHARQNIVQSDECLESKIDIALDRVLEELI